MRVLAIALLLTVTIAQASLVERKRAGRGLQDAEDNIGADSFGKPETFDDGEACGVLNSPPCKDEGCFQGLVLDTVGWTYLSTIPLFHCLISPYTPECCEVFPGPCLPFNETGVPGPGPELGSEPEFPGNYLENWPPQDAPICVPCGGLYQIPCPCGDECVAAPKCSEGLKATNLLAKFLTGSFGGDSRVMEPVRGPLFPSDPSFFQLSASIDLCLPCGGYGQPCCCDSSEIDKFLLSRGIVLPDEDNTLLEFLLENTKNDPNKCLSGCNPYTDFNGLLSAEPLACGANNICHTPDP